jgi:hypothetical protein
MSAIGSSLLDADYRGVALSALGLGMCLTTAKRLRSGRWPDLSDFAAGFISLLSIYSAIVIGAVFLLTRPPAIQKLGDLELGSVGLVSFVCLFFLGVREAYGRFIRKAGPPPTEPIEIRSAQYGVLSAQIDVTERVRTYVCKGVLNILATNDIVCPGKDPSPGARKGLTIDYTLNGRDRRIEIIEGSRLTLP